MAKSRPGKQDAANEIMRLVEQLVAMPSAKDQERAQLVRTIPKALFERRVGRARHRLGDALLARGTSKVPTDVRAQLDDLIRRWSERDYDDAFPEVEQFELECFRAGEAASSARDEAWFAEEERRHRAAIESEHGKIEIRGLQMSARVFQSLDVAYVPLFVQDEPGAEQVIRLAEGMELRTIPRLRVPKLVAKYERIVLVGAPGSGKSTIVAYLAAQSAAKRLAKEAGWKEDPVPFVVPVRSIGKSKIDENTIASCMPSPSVDLVRRVLSERRGFVLIDGIDEAQEGPEALKAHAEAFARAYPGNRVFATSRPAGGVEAKRVEIPGFVTITLEPMGREEVYTFIDRWCLAAEVSIQKDEMRAKADAKRAADDLKGRVERSRPIERMAQTPLICSVLCVVHRFLGQRVPERRAALYEACTNVLLYEWDRAKFPEGSAIGELDAQAKRFLLSQLARWMHEQGMAEVGTADVITRFEETLPRLGREAGDAARIIREIEHRSGILLERRPGFYAFSHLTFQEYLTAVAFVHANEAKALVKKATDPFWHEVIALAAGMPGADAAGMIRGLLKGTGPTGAFLAANCVETAIELPMTVRQEVDKKIRLLVPPKDDGDISWLISLGQVVGPMLLRALPDSDADGQARIVAVLGAIAYEPAINTIIRMLSSTSTRITGLSISAEKVSFVMDSSFTLADVASCALFFGAERSDLFREQLDRHLGSLTYWGAALAAFIASEPADSVGTALHSVATERLPRIKALLAAHRTKPTPSAHSDSPPPKT